MWPFGRRSRVMKPDEIPSIPLNVFQLYQSMLWHPCRTLTVSYYAIKWIWQICFFSSNWFIKTFFCFPLKLIQVSEFKWLCSVCVKVQACFARLAVHDVAVSSRHDVPLLLLVTVHFLSAGNSGIHSTDLTFYAVKVTSSGTFWRIHFGDIHLDAVLSLYSNSNNLSLFYTEAPEFYM